MESKLIAALGGLDPEFVEGLMREGFGEDPVGFVKRELEGMGARENFTGGGMREVNRGVKALLGTDVKGAMEFMEGKRGGLEKAEMLVGIVYIIAAIIIGVLFVVQKRNDRQSNYMPEGENRPNIKLAIRREQDYVTTDRSTLKEKIKISDTLFVGNVDIGKYADKIDIQKTIFMNYNPSISRYDRCDIPTDIYVNFSRRHEFPQYFSELVKEALGNKKFKKIILIDLSKFYTKSFDTISLQLQDLLEPNGKLYQKRKLPNGNWIDDFDDPVAPPTAQSVDSDSDPTSSSSV